MEIPVVAIIGRPNVGKSSLLNSMVRSRVSIVDPKPGVTRDRVSVFVHHKDRTFELVDTGGIGIVDVEELSEHVKIQIDFAIENADVVVFAVDVRDGLTPVDRSIAELLRKSKKPVVLCANKADAQKFEHATGEFFKLGMGEALAVSARERVNIDALADRILEKLPGDKTGLPDEPVMKIAIVGKRNAGKSTFVNALAKCARQIVSDVPGTTRDAVDVRFEHKGRPFIAIDTAGIRKAKSFQDSVELYSQARSERAIRRADVVLFLIESITPLSVVDKQIGQMIVDEHKPCVLILNKWDLAADTEPGKFTKYLSEMLPGLDHAPIVYASALNRQNVSQSVDVAVDLFKQSQTRVGTGELNRALVKIVKEGHHRIKKVSQAPKFYYATQAEICPPTFIFFVNNPAFVEPAFQRYMENALRKMFHFNEVPLKIIFKMRKSKYAKEKSR